MGDDNKSQILLAIDACVGAVGDNKGINIGESPVDYLCSYPRLCGLICKTNKYFPLLKNVKNRVEFYRSLLINVNSKILDEKSPINAEILINHGDGKLYLQHLMELFSTIIKKWVEKLFPEIIEDVKNELKINQYQQNIGNYRDIIISANDLFNEKNKKTSCCNEIITKCDEYNCCLADYKKYRLRIFYELLDKTDWNNIFILNSIRSEDISFNLDDIMKSSKMLKFIQSCNGEFTMAARNMIAKFGLECIDKIMISVFHDYNPGERKMLDGLGNEKFGNMVSPDYLRDHVFKHAGLQFSPFYDSSIPSYIKKILEKVQEARSISEDDNDTKLLVNNIIKMSTYTELNAIDVIYYHINHGGKIWIRDKQQISINIWSLWCREITNSNVELIKIADKVRAYRKCVNGTTLCLFPFILILAALAAVIYALYIQFHG